jgi:uncharacterized protein (TIGR02217 family)
MAFYESPRFPDDISRGATGGAAYLTDVTVVASGYENRNAAWSQARMVWDVSLAPRAQTDWQILLAHFRSVRGRLHGFRFKDWSDYAAAVGAGILTATGVTDEYQMYKRYSSGAQTEDRLIAKPITGKITLAGGGTYVVDYATGKVTRSAGAAPTGWSGEFDVPCRYDTDAMKGTLVHRTPTGGEIMEWHSIPIVELRLA